MNITQYEEERLRQIAKDEMKKAVMDNLDGTTIFMYVSELENTLEQYKQKEADSIPKSIIRDMLRKCEAVYNKEVKPYETPYVTFLTKSEEMELINKRNCLLVQMSTYKQLLGEEI